MLSLAIFKRDQTGEGSRKGNVERESPTAQFPLDVSHQVVKRTSLHLAYAEI